MTELSRASQYPSRCQQVGLFSKRSLNDLNQKVSQSSIQFLAPTVDIYVHLRSQYVHTASCVTCTLSTCTVDYLDIYPFSVGTRFANAKTLFVFDSNRETFGSLGRNAFGHRYNPDYRRHIVGHVRTTNHQQTTTNQPINQPTNQPSSTINNDNRVRSPNSYCVAVRACVSEDR